MCCGGQRSTTGASTTGRSSSVIFELGMNVTCLRGLPCLKLQSQDERHFLGRCWIPASILDVDPETVAQFDVVD